MSLLHMTKYCTSSHIWESFVCPSWMRGRTKSTTSWLDMKFQIPSHARTINSSSAGSTIRVLTLGNAVIICSSADKPSDCFYAWSPETDKYSWQKNSIMVSNNTQCDPRGDANHSPVHILEVGSIAGWSTSTGLNGKVLVIPNDRLESLSRDLVWVPGQKSWPSIGFNPGL